MGSKYPPGFYDEDKLKAVEGAFRDVWDSLATSNPSQNTDRDGLRVAVIHRLLDLVEQGVTDPDELRFLTLSHFTAQPRT
jgi:hypothetical protein